MIAKKALERRLKTLPDNSVVFINDGGLTLEASVPGREERPYLEVGGDPEEKAG